MADLVYRRKDANVDGTLRDMGDGTFAEVVAVEAAEGSTDISFDGTPVTQSDPLPVVQAALDETVDTVSAVGFTAIAAAATMTRPGDTNAYALGDLVANSTTAGSVTPLSFSVARVDAGSGMVRRVRLRKSTATVAAASFRLHLYAASPTVTNGDNGAWLSNQVANYLGALDVTSDRAFSDGAAGNGVPTTGAEINFVLASGQTIYGLLEARAAYSPGNQETFTVSLEVIQN